jgi:hypothetical protein
VVDDLFKNVLTELADRNQRGVHDTDKYKFNVVEQIFGRYDAVGVQDKYIYSFLTIFGIVTYTGFFYFASRPRNPYSRWKLFLRFYQFVNVGLLVQR